MNIGIDYGNDNDYSAVTFAIKTTGGGVVVIDTLTAEPADAFIALLRVARAAKAYYGAMIGEDLGRIEEELAEALKEVEDLLD